MDKVQILYLCMFFISIASFTVLVIFKHPLLAFVPLLLLAFIKFQSIAG